MTAATFRLEWPLPPPILAIFAVIKLITSSPLHLNVPVFTIMLNIPAPYPISSHVNMVTVPTIMSLTWWGGEFDFFCKSELIRPSMAVQVRQRCKFLADLYDNVRSSGIPNHRGCKIKLPGSLRGDVFRKYLGNYPDAIIADYIDFGFPLSYYYPFMPDQSVTVHPSGLHHADKVDVYFGKETAHGAIIGPFDVKPFIEAFRINPVMTAPKFYNTAKWEGCGAHYF